MGSGDSTEEKKENPLPSKDDLPDIQSSIAHLREQEAYPFFERLTGIMALLFAGCLIGGITLMLLEMQVGNWNQNTLLTVAFGITGASWLILIPTAALLTAIGRAVQHVNKTGEELRPDWERSAWTVGEHAVRVAGGVVILYGFYMQFLQDLYGPTWETLIFILGISAVVLFGFGLVVSGIIGLGLFLSRELLG